MSFPPNSTLFAPNGTFLSEPPISKCEFTKRMCDYLMAQILRNSTLKINKTANFFHGSLRNATPGRMPPGPLNKDMFGPPKQCIDYKQYCTLNNITDRLVMASAAIGLLAVLLNIFVICRILSQNILKVHQSKVYFLSMAIADFYQALCCVIYSFVHLNIISRPSTKSSVDVFFLWWTISSSISFNASLLHVIIVTADRLAATTFPLFHKVHVNRKKILVTVFCTWIVAVVIGIIPIWLKSPVLVSWITALLGGVTCIMLIITYTHISAVALRRKATLKSLRRTKKQKTATNKSINTTFLSTAIAGSFIVCNLFGITYVLLVITKYIEMVRDLDYLNNLLLTINSGVNPVVYTIFELINKKATNPKPNTTQTTTYSKTATRRRVVETSTGSGVPSKQSTNGVIPTGASNQGFEN